MQIGHQKLTSTHHTLLLPFLPKLEIVRIDIERIKPIPHITSGRRLDFEITYIFHVLPRNVIHLSFFKMFPSCDIKIYLNNTNGIACFVITIDGVMIHFHLGGYLSIYSRRN